jgi:flavin reductase (DIM6/NTAB) family NADH-FMN oxidoreductase RutF
VIEIDAAALHPRDAYALLTSFIVPRAIAWVTTMEPSGHTNIAPFSYFTGLGGDPPMITLAILDRKDGPKDTLRIARATGALCVHLVEEHDAQRMNATSGDYPPDVSEATTLAIDTVPCTRIAGRRIASARAALECTLVDVHTYGRKQRANLVVAEVVYAHVADEITSNGTIDPRKVSPVARLGGPTYATLAERFTMERPKV